MKKAARADTTIASEMKGHLRSEITRIAVQKKAKFKDIGYGRDHKYPAHIQKLQRQKKRLEKQGEKLEQRVSDFKESFNQKQEGQRRRIEEDAVALREQLIFGDIAKTRAAIKAWERRS